MFVKGESPEAREKRVREIMKRLDEHYGAEPPIF